MLTFHLLLNNIVISHVILIKPRYRFENTGRFLELILGDDDTLVPGTVEIAAKKEGLMILLVDHHGDGLPQNRELQVFGAAGGGVVVNDP